MDSRRALKSGEKYTGFGAVTSSIVFILSLNQFHHLLNEDIRTLQFMFFFSFFNENYKYVTQYVATKLKDACALEGKL